MQALVDTRSEVERWADRPVEVSIFVSHVCDRFSICVRQFHFSSVLSPWTRRALVAGGFGIASSQRSFPTEVSPVVPSYDDFNDEHKHERRISDAEGQTAESSIGAPTEKHVDEGALILDDMPFFHFALASAVAAAERDLTTSRRSSVTELKK